MATPSMADSAMRPSRTPKLYTPATTNRMTIKTPHSRRVKASIRASRANIGEGDVAEQSFKDLLCKQWNVYSLSPLFNFKYGREMFKRYARSLDMAFTQALNTQARSKEVEVRSSIEVYPGLNFHPDDHEAVRIHVTERNPREGKESVVLRAVLLCVDMGETLFPHDLAPSFTYFPTIIISGNKGRASVLLEWLEQHFDCRTSPLVLTHSDLQWLLAVGCSEMNGDKNMDVFLQYDLSKVCSGINVMNSTFEFEFCQELWNRLSDDPQSKDSISDEEVQMFFTSLEHHLEHTMHICVSKLRLQEVGSPMAYVSSKGKFKMFSQHSVYPTLHLICDFARDRFIHFYQF